MFVTKIVPLTKTRFQIYLDDKPAFILYKGELQKYGLIPETDISAAIVQQIKEEVLLKRAKLRALHLLNDMDRTEDGLLQKLLQGGYPNDVSEAAVSYVKSFGYIDDKRYAEQYIRSRMLKKSKRELYVALVGKGLRNSVIEEALENCFSDMCEQETIMQLLKKKNYDNETADDTSKKKMFDYLLRKGFRYEDIRQALQVSSTNA